MRRITLSVLALLVAAAAQAASVEVRFVHPENYADAGSDSRSREDVQLGLAKHLQRLGATLPSSQALAIEVLDIDLAGEVRPTRRLWPDTRVMRGNADWPNISLRYTWRDGSQVLASAEERVSDMHYLMSSHIGAGDQNESLRYEKRMLARWFAERFGKRP